MFLVLKSIRIDHVEPWDFLKGLISIDFLKGLKCKVVNLEMFLLLKGMCSVKTNLLRMRLRESMKKVPYATAVESLMYAQVCNTIDIAFLVGVLGRFLDNPSMEHSIAAKKVMRYLQRTKDFMLVYKKVDHLEVIGY